ncbi:maleylpyruvate isomerase N-terminal domain-containing protein [Streptomyces griseocarneus]|uniref:maleylpyruvate isomerase N-terminal domain-containing protein n=1 Tax=Streptomyces griseocarneus TaxID=51201 RepID=UPI00167D68B9|nr:maleylpyruvate isomerase N-terminal domain-containing protein [Streptomyces griseocarneus]MBZ6473956.1 maleylpyruvate isomerase N-terminal domain-containing protein [Streptomyces griseocarneus]
MDVVYSDRLDALEQTWRIWADLGAELTERQWTAATRCPGWDVAAVYAHHSTFPRDMDGPLPPLSGRPGVEPVTAVEMVRRFNAPGGVAHEAADAVAKGAVSGAAEAGGGGLVERFAVRGPGAVRRLRAEEPARTVPWGATGLTLELAEAVRIVLLEATVHLLDVQRALDRPPLVPPQALSDTALLLAEVAPPVDFIEAATGRSARSPLPVLR